jgi:hypothetical protein
MSDCPQTEILFIQDLVSMLRMSRATIERRRKARTFPIPELPKVDDRPRWSRHAVERYLNGKR